MAKKIISVFLVVLVKSVIVFADFSPFASSVIKISQDFPTDYIMAPSQFARHSVPYNQQFLDPTAAIGSPDIEFELKSVVTLGGFGGTIVLAFDHNVEDNPANPMGLDAIVFGNAFFSEQNIYQKWAEFATIEIMPEVNGNNIPGDDPAEKWYLIPGSHLNASSQKITATWNKNTLSNLGRKLFYYPTFPGWPTPEYQTSSYQLFPVYSTDLENVVLENPNISDNDPANDFLEYYWGYADATPTLRLGDRDGNGSSSGVGDVNTMSPDLFFTVPDDPCTVGITNGSAGGDAFDIAWAVNPQTWQRANLTSFKYIRITNAVDVYLNQYDDLGEISTEIDAVADARPVGDINGDNVVDYQDIFLFTQAWLTEWPQQDFNPAADLNTDNKIDFADFAKFSWGWSMYQSWSGN